MADSIYELAREDSSRVSVLNSVTSVSSNRSSYLSCRICLSCVQDAASLTCGHKFCETCLKQYWEAKDKPDFLVCPLCRKYAFNVDFTEKQHESTAEFQKTFNPMLTKTESIDNNIHNITSKCLTFSLLVPAMYYLVKWLGVPLIGHFPYIPK